jgi:hypothetical protein
VVLEHDQILTSTDRAVAGLNLNYQFNDNNSASYRIGYNKYNLNRKQIRDIGSRAEGGVGSLTYDDFLMKILSQHFY